MAYESATYYTNKIIKTTKAQYDALKNGESVKGYKLNEKDTFVLDIDSLYNDIPTKTSQLTIDNAIALKAGTNVSLINDGSGVTINADGSVKTVNNIAPDSSGNIALDYVPEQNMLAANTNLNTVTTSGFYRLQAISTLINGLDVSYGQMIVCQGGGDTIAQLVFPYLSSKMLFRTGYPVNNPGGKWNDWKTVSTDGHTHDDRYYTESEVDSKLNGKSNTGHTHQALKILCSINGANTNTYKYRRIISTPVMTGNYTDMSGTYYLYGRYHNAPWYIFRVEVRTNNSSTGVLASAGIQVIATNRDPADLLGGLYTVATNGKTTTYLDVYYKSPYTYVRTQLAYLGVEPFGEWTYYNSNEDDKSTNPVNAYKTLEGNTSDAASFGARGIEKYTRIVYGSFVGKVGKSTYLVSPATSRITSANIDQTPLNGNSDGQGQLRLDLATSSMSINQPASPGYIMSYIWDNNVSVASQLFIPTGDYFVQGYRPSLRGCDKGTWQTSWTELAYYKDLDNYTRKTITIPDNTSLDTVTESGFYRLSMNPNFPHAQMIVSRGADTIAQMAFPYADTTMYVRTGNPFNTSGGLWHDWKQVAFTDHTHTSLNTAFVFNNNDMPQGSANLSATTNAHQISFYRNGLSVPYQMDNPNDGGILRCRGTNESNTIFELATWNDAGVGETIQFNYYPTNSQATPTYSVSVPKKTGTIALTSDIPTHWANIPLSNTSDANTTPTFASVDIKSKCTVSYSATADALEFIFK